MSTVSARVIRGSPAGPGPDPVGDWRVERMLSLVEDPWLPGEWDPVRLLLVPGRGGLLSRRKACAVAACPHDRNGTHPFCDGHAAQFARSEATSVELWAVEGAGSVRRRLSDECCAVLGESGGSCPRPAGGARGLCVAHNATWVKQHRRGVIFEGFLAGARPLTSFGDCTAACCYRVAAHGRGLCETHYKTWIVDGSPRGEAFEAWRARARQPATRRVLSLRGLPELVRLEVLYAIQRRVADQIRTAPENMSNFVDRVRTSGVSSVLDFDPAIVDPHRNKDYGRFARYVLDRVALAYRHPEVEVTADRWDLRVFGRRGQLDFSAIRQDWLREGTKRWAAATMGRGTDGPTMQARVRAVGVLSEVLASGPKGGNEPSALGRADIDRFLLRLRSLRSPTTGEALSVNWAFGIAKHSALVVREAAEMGFLAGLGPTFAFRRGDARWPIPEDDPGRAIPAHVITQLDAHLDLLAGIPGSTGGPSHRSLGVLGDRAGATIVVAYQLLKHTGRRLGEVASLHLDCLDVDENAKAVLVYDNHKAGRMGRRLPVTDTELVEAVRNQQRWVAERFPNIPRSRLWLLPRPTRNGAGTAHISAGQLYNWLRAWVAAIPRIDAGPADEHGEPIPFPRSAITPHAFRHTYAQTLADQGVPAPVLRDLMDHHHVNTTLGYYRVSETKKRQAMELLARHTVDNRGTTRPAVGQSRTGQLREQLSWVAVPMGKCSEPANVRSGGQTCPIRYQCAGCPHFESDPSYLPELNAYANDLRREREASLAMGVSTWVIDNIDRQLGVIVEHIGTHEHLLDGLPAEQRASIDCASATLRKARQSVPVAFGRRTHDDSHD